MKRVILFVLVAMGLGFVAKGQTEYLVTVDPATGVFTKVNSIPGVMYITAEPDVTTIDNTNNYFIFVGHPPVDSISYLYSLNNNNGDIISDPLFSVNKGLLYGDLLKILYGIEEQNGVFYLVSVNSVTGGYTTINALNDGFDGALQMTYNHNLNELIILAQDISGNLSFFIVDGKTGDIISKTVTTYYYSEIHFDNTTNQLFVVQSSDSSGIERIQLGTINIATGAFSALYNFPSDEYLAGYSTFDEKDQEYIDATIDSVNHWHLYFINVATGKVVYRDSVEAATQDGDNVLEYRYDNSTNILYALHWEEFTTPVTLLSFTATKQVTQNLLQWTTTQEVNSSYFGVERSSDGVNFIGIGQVDAAGNSSVVKSYSLVDVKPVNGMNYYRLKMVDKDGKFSYSQVRSINEAVSFGMSIYPNPVVNKLNLNISSDKAMTVEVEVVDNGGKVIAEHEMEVAAGVSTESINVGGLSNGEYYVRVVGSEGEMEERFVRE